MPRRRWSRVAAAVALILCASPALLHAQTGRIIGRIVDQEQGAPVAGAQIEIAGTGLRAVSALDGRYTLNAVPAGPVTLHARMIGYTPKNVTGLVVPDGEVVAQDVALSRRVVELQEITVTAAAERGTVNRALEDQRDATGIINAVTAEQIARSPDGDAGQAVQRVSGVNVQDGRYVFVRGLGERYTTTSLNGARIPSPEPERRVVPLDLFPAGLLEGITTSKTFTPDQPGDFAGAAVDLRTREFPLGRVVTLSTSVGVNTAVTGRDVVRAPTVGTEWLGAAGGARELPAPLDGLRTTQGLSEEQINGLVGSFRNAWTPGVGTGSAAGSFGLSVGGEDPVFGQMLGYIGSLTYSYGQEVRRDEERAQVTRAGESLERFNVYQGSTGRLSVLWGAMLNLSTRIGGGTKLSFDNSLTRTADNEANEVAGHNEEFDTPLVLSRLSFVARTVRSSRLAGEHLLGDRHLLDWSVTSSGVGRYEPDRADLRYVAAPDPATGRLERRELFVGNYGAVRTFSDLDETGWDLKGNYRLTVGSLDNPALVKLGAAYRTVDRDAFSQPYDLRGDALTAEERSRPAEEIFGGTWAAEGKLGLSVNPIGSSYTAADRLAAGYVMADLPLTPALRAVAGARIERWDLEVGTFDVASQRDTVSTRRNTDLLPSLALNWALAVDQNLRASATQTLSRPEYREISPGQSYNAIDNIFLQGNGALERSLVRNYDLRWEWFPAPGEVLSVGVFAKQFQRPIEQVYVFRTGATSWSWINADGADNYGLELEVRKQLGFLAAPLRPFTLFANTTLMRSSITPGDSSLTSRERPMVGQAEYVVNGGLNWTTDDGRWSATALYNVVGPRIVAAGFRPYPDVYEEARHLVDLSIQAPVWASLTLKFDAKNLLDQAVEQTQGGLTRLKYRTGRSFALGAKWSL